MIKEYLIRISDETEGKENIPVTPQGAVQNNISPTSPTVLRSSGSNTANNAKTAKTSVYLNAGLQIAMPALNALTNGIAGNAVGKVRKIVSFGSALLMGASVGGVIGAGASLATWGVSELVNVITDARNVAEENKWQERETERLRKRAGFNAEERGRV